MTVKKLILKLKKMPPNLEVAFRDHDMNAYEINSIIKNVYIQDFSENKNKEITDNQHEIRKGEMVILSS